MDLQFPSDEGYDSFALIVSGREMSPRMPLWHLRSVDRIYVDNNEKRPNSAHTRPQIEMWIKNFGYASDVKE